MRKVPEFALYGSDAPQPAWIDWVHFERIPDRSRLFDWEIEPHVHEALIQVVHPRSGGPGGEAFIDGMRWAIEPPCLIVAPAHSVHGFRFAADVDGPVVTAAQRPLEAAAAVVAPELLQTLRRPAVLPVDAAGRDAGTLMPLFDAIEREAQRRVDGEPGAGMPLLVALFVQIARIGASAAAAVPAGGEGAVRSRKAQQIERFRAMVDARFRERRPVEAYAADLGVTAGQLTRLCREVLGTSSLHVINARVLHEAQRELVYSSLGIKQIAAQLGFDDEAYFGRFFKKHSGHRPGDFRRMARQRLAAG